MAELSSRKNYIQLLRMLNAYESAVNEAAIVSITDLQGKIIFVNEKFTQISKYTAAELLGKTHRIINSGYHPSSFFKEMWFTLSKGLQWRGEIKNRAKDGTYYWVDTVIAPVRDHNNAIIQYLSIRNLITVQKENEEKLLLYQNALLKRKQQLKDAQEVAKTGSWYLNVAGDLLEWSDETYRIFEIPPHTKMTYEKFLDAVHPNDRQMVDQKWREALAKGSYEAVHRINTGSGEKWVRENARFEFDPSASLISAVGTVQDITEKKRIDDILKESEYLYRSLFNNSPFAIGIMEKSDYRFVEVNETATKLYGYSREEFLKLTAYDIRVPEQHNLLREQLVENNGEARLHKKKNGDIIIVEPAITAIQYKNKEAFLITITDITEKIKVEQELQRSKANRQMEITRASIKAEEKSKGEIGRELHDNVNQLLVASSMYLKRIVTTSERDKELLETAKHIVTTAVGEIRKLSSLFIPPPLKDLTLKNVIEQLGAVLKLADVVPVFDIRINDATLDESFKTNIYRIIQELCNNIIKYAHAKKASISAVQNDGTVLIAVKDNGVGFDPSQKISGMGLANIIQRAEAYKGKVLIDSEINKGCRVSIEFPVQ